MHNSYYLLKQLCTQLNEVLKGMAIVSSFSQEKDELIFEFAKGGQSIFIRAHLTPAFSCLSFPSTFHRARKNSVELFTESNLKKFIAATEFENERALAIQLDDGLSIIFKMYGNRSNVLLAQHDQVIRIFKNNLTEDLGIAPVTLNRSIDWSKEFFFNHHTTIRKHYFTWGKEVWRYLEKKGFANQSIEGQWMMIEQTQKVLEHPTYSIVQTNGNLTLSLLPQENPIVVFDHAMEAITEFFQKVISTTSLDRERAEIIKLIQAKIVSGNKYIEKNSQQLQKIEHDQHYKHWADLIMAHLHTIKGGQHSVTLTDFTTGSNPSIVIKLNPQLSPQKNAEQFYRKAKNQNIEIQKLKEGIAQKRKEIEGLQSDLREVENLQSLMQVRRRTEPFTSLKRENKVRLPFFEATYHGFQIWIGRNATDNDELTLKHSHKNDLWLHAKDVAGSHVLVKFQPGKTFPKDVIERAAQLAAWYSKRKTEGLVPVAYTPKKFVRKRKGDPAGLVIVEREKVTLVEPKPL